MKTWTKYGIDFRHGFAVPSALFKPKTGPPRRIPEEIFDKLSEEAVSAQQSARTGVGTPFSTPKDHGSPCGRPGTAVWIGGDPSWAPAFPMTAMSAMTGDVGDLDLPVPSRLFPCYAPVRSLFRIGSVQRKRRMESGFSRSSGTTTVTFPLLAGNGKIAVIARDRVIAVIARDWEIKGLCGFPITRSSDHPIFYDGKWKCTSCLEATGVPSSVAGW